MTKLETKIEKLKAPTRSGASVTATFEVPAKAKKSGAADKTRVTGLDMRWVFDAVPSTKGLKKAKGDVVTADTTNKNKTKEDTETFDRKSFWPYPKKPKMSNIEFWVRGYNVQGSGAKAKKVYGPWVHKALKIAKPDAPKSCAMSYNAENGKVTPSYVSERPDGAKEAHTTQVWVTAGKNKLIDGTEYKDATKTITAVEIPGATTLGIGAWVKLSMSARNRGLGGDSGKTNAANVYVCHPNPPVCGEPVLVYATQGTLSTASVRVPITNPGNAYDGKTAIRPTTVKLQRLVNSETENDKTSAAASQNWADVTTDDGQTSGMTDAWATCVSDAGKYTWFRAVAIRDGYTTYGVPVRAKCIDVLTSSTVAGAANITSIVSGADGESAKVTLTGKQSDDVGYEVSWSTAADAWESTEQPEAFHTTGSTLVVRALDEGTRYYMRARAYDVDSEGNYIYGQYCNNVQITPTTTPSAVALSSPSTIERGRDIQYTWTYDTDAPQKSWKLVDGSGRVVMSGNGTSCAATVTPERYGNASSVTYHVEMTTGGGWAKSNDRTVQIADAPTCTLTAPATLTAQPYSFTVASDTGDTVRVAITALGSSGTGLYGDREQFAGDTVHSATLTPTFSNGTAIIELPGGLAFYNGANYELSVTAVDNATGLESPTATARFAVDWARTATQAPGTVVVDSDAKSVTVTVNAPVGVAIGDVFDLYRVTADGERRIATAQPFGTAITDRLAPFTSDGENLRYFAVTRTADGDTCISDDYTYTLAGGALRFDWGADFIELPYNLKLEDKISKDSETRKHMDGTTQAYWNRGVTRKSSLSTDLIRFEDAEQQELLRSMLRHPGSVFVRTPDGLAYAADVQPGTISRSHGSGTVGVSLEATEHDLTDESRPADADIVQPSWGGGALDALGGTVYDGVGKFPLPTWLFVGYAGTTLYVCDPDGTVRDGTGAAKAGWTYDGETLRDANEDEVAVTEEPEE